MDPALYKLLHFIGVVLLVAGLAALLSRNTRAGAALHGFGLVLVLVSGFALATKLGYGFPWWILAKVGIWLALAAMITVAKKELLKPPVAWSVALGLVLAAVFVGWRFGVVAM